MSIIVKLMGGMGNQMFQYALGRKLSLKLEVPLLLDLGYYDQQPGEHTSRAFDLDAFELEIRRATDQQIRLARHGGSSLRAGLARIHHRLAPAQVIREQGPAFDPRVLAVKDGSTLEGYWQSERYFSDIADVIRKDFTFRGGRNGVDAGPAARIRSTAAVSLHVRRGDYVTQAAARGHFHTCSPAYYEEAMSRMLAHMPNAEFYIFSDDPVWARENIRSAAPVHLVDGDRSAPNDMRLMSMCRHHIIANSSFSWWAAWLNPSPDKLVIAPKQWFRDPAIDTSDLIPKGWMRL